MLGRARRLVRNSEKFSKRAVSRPLMVTHDRTEALALSDFIVVMNNGKIEQAGAPQTVYDSPESEFVATFVGGMNIVRLPAVNNGETDGHTLG